jgi:signal transduction histidine kinase
MTIRTRLALGLSAIALLLVVPLLLALRSLQRLHDATEELRDREFAASFLLGRIRTGSDDLRRAEDRLLYVRDVASREAMAGALNRLLAMADSLDAYALDTAARHVRAAIGEVSQFAPLEYAASLEGQLARAESISTAHVRPAIARVDGWTGQAERDLRVRTQARVNAAALATEQATQLSAASLALALTLALGIGVWLTRSISRPVRDLEQGMRAVADGDFSHELALAPSRGDEFGRLAGSFYTMAQQLSELDRLKAEFVSVASHELRTPINVILGYLQLLEEGVYGELTPSQRDISRTLEAQTQSLSRLVRQLLDISRFEAGGAKLEPRRTDLTAFLDELESAFRVLALQREIGFVVQRGPGLPGDVHWDSDRMNEVLGNLLSNAFKFTERGGRVELSVESIDGCVQMEVRDTGAGIPAEQLPHIFEKFYQADNQRDSSKGGTGLGLAIAKGIVEAHRGTITCDSTPGVGTTFTIVMPTRASGRRPALQREEAATPA